MSITTTFVLRCRQRFLAAELVRLGRGTTAGQKVHLQYLRAEHKALTAALALFVVPRQDIRGLVDRRQSVIPPCRCGHFARVHEEIWDPEALKAFWFCHGCERDHKTYPDTYHAPTGGRRHHR